MPVAASCPMHTQRGSTAESWPWRAVTDQGQGQDWDLDLLLAEGSPPPQIHSSAE
jgi:hypothetical protein